MATKKWSRNSRKPSRKSKTLNARGGVAALGGKAGEGARDGADHVHRLVEHEARGVAGHLQVDHRQLPRHALLQPLEHVGAAVAGLPRDLLRDRPHRGPAQHVLGGH